MNSHLLLVMILGIQMSSGYAQDTLKSMQQLRAEVNYEEKNVPDYALPSLFAGSNDANLIDATTWNNKIRPEWLELFEREMYGHFPDEGLHVSFIINSDQMVFGDKFRRKEVTINVSNGRHGHDISLLLYLPTKVRGPVPMFVGLNFYGNHTIHSDPGISIHRSWARNNEDYGISNNRVDDKSRGIRANRWPVEQIIQAGFGLGTIYYGDIDPDYDDGFNNGIHSLLDEEVDKSTLSSISAWAWGLSQALNYFEQDSQIDHDHVAVIGHSRLGKTSLLAGALDQRFAMVVSNDSGCGGAALSRREFGETVHIINRSFPHWFNERFNHYNEQVNKLPFDQHSLLALAAPRPLYVASASEDLWADPHGEFLAAKEASKVYNLLGEKGLEDASMPAADSPSNKGVVGYHMRSGKHDITSYDWAQYLSFASRHFKK
ncbi:MAG: acetylxylan esterase [Saprospiraceae bacterium]|nr:acetylxylan esterase [Saprospiraceae bacterium]